MKKRMIKVMAVLLVVITATSCYGPFRLTTKLHGWNSEVSDKKMVNELVFLGLCIIPVYEICALGDALIFNSIEFWGGNNPIAMQDGDMEEVEVNHKGQKYQIIKTKNNMTVAQKGSEEEADFRYFPEENKWYHMDGENKLMAVQ